jgi:tRNA threonylcarbamoyl adenosine modification protein YeaZ
MLLIFDTSRSKTFVALALDQKNIKKIIWDARFAHSEELLPKISELLAKNKLSADSIVGISTISGPGSYTGLRVGAACANALSYALNIPVVGINKLELLARLGLEYSSCAKKFQYKKTNFCSLIYAAVSQQFFGAIYKIKSKNSQILEQVEDFFVGDPRQLNDLIKERTLFLIGDDRDADSVSLMLEKNLSDKFLGIKYFDLFDDKALEVLAELSFQKLEGRKPGEIVTPLYIRKPNIMKSKV